MAAKKVLVVEDDQFLKNIYEVKLKAEGYDVEIATDGEDGLVKISSFEPDIILLDLIMPKLNGFEVLEELNKKKIKTPVIVLSNLGQEEDIERAKGLGAVDYLVKASTPINEVVNKIESIIK